MFKPTRKPNDVLTGDVVHHHHHTQGTIALSGRNERKVRVEEPAATFSLLTIAFSRWYLLLSLGKVDNAPLEDEVVPAY